MRTPVRILGYARVSSAEQALGTSLEDQQNVIRAHARKLGRPVTRMYVEAESAVYDRIERREQVRALMVEVGKGDLVLVDKLDRWSRDPEFTYSSIRQIHERGAHFYAIGDDCDPSTPAGDTMLGFRVLFAREEHKRIRLRLVGTRKTLRGRGYYVEGLPPWGYRRPDVKGAERNVLFVDPVESARVREAFRLCIRGESMNEIARALGEKRDRVADTLHNRTYLGEMRNLEGHWARGKHEPIIDPRTFADAQASIERRRNGCRRASDSSLTATWWLRDLARCALCGAKMSAAYGGPVEARRGYFRCYARCTTRYVPVLVAERDADPIVSARLVELREQIAGARDPKPAAGPDVEALRAKLQRKRDRHLETYADGYMTREQLRVVMEKLDGERTRVDALATAPVPIDAPARRKLLESVSSMRRSWAKATPTERRTVVFALANAALLTLGRIPQFEWLSIDAMARKV